MLQAVRFLAVLFAALALVPAGAHLAELPHKIGMPAEQYLVVQQIYRGWALFGIAVIGALVFTGALAWLQHKRGEGGRAALVAFLCIVGTQLVFWTYTQPANRATNNWSMLPPGNWMALRTQWEYSHAASAVLNLAALAAAIGAVLQRRRPAVG